MAHNTRALLQEWFKDSVPTDLITSTKTVLGSATSLVNANARRVILKVTNQGTNLLSIYYDPSVTSSNGFLLSPGFTLIVNWQDDLEEVVRPFWALAVMGTAAVSIVETVLTGRSDSGPV